MSGRRPTAAEARGWSSTLPLLPCADPACSARVPASQLACPDDWRRLPKPLKAAVDRAWSERLKGRHGSAERHQQARAAAVTWYRGHPK